MKTIDSRPIIDLTPDMGLVLLIGRNSVPGTATRAALGYKTLDGKYLTADDEPFALGEHDAIAFIAKPYDDGAALAWDAPETPKAIIDLYAAVKGIAKDMPKSIGHDLTVKTIDSLLGDRSQLLYVSDPMMDALIEVSDGVGEVNAGHKSAQAALEDIRRIFRVCDSRSHRAQSHALRKDFSNHSNVAHDQILTFLRIARSQSTLGDTETLRLLGIFGSQIDMKLVEGSEAERSLVHQLRKMVRNCNHNSASYIVGRIIRAADLHLG